VGLLAAMGKTVGAFLGTTPIPAASPKRRQSETDVGIPPSE